MKTAFTTEQLQNFYKQAMQYCVAAYGSEPDRITIEEDGTLHACWEHYHCGETEYEYEYISQESLSEDLEELYNKRKEEEEKARVKAEQERLERQKIYDTQQKEKRKQEYLKLKKEFEQ